MEDMILFLMTLGTTAVWFFVNFLKYAQCLFRVERIILFILSIDIVKVA